MRYFISFLIFFATWIIWSGLFDAWHLSLGAISSALVAYMSHDLLFRSEKLQRSQLKELSRFMQYLPWLFYQIFLANIHIVKLAFHPRMYDRIDPHIIKFRTKLKKDFSLVTFANSITLTPGTVTVLIKDGYYYVHAIDMKVAGDLPGEMEKRCGHIYMED
jgi:multicomponent Na+:H+ antiporter subunit E